MTTAVAPTWSDANQRYLMAAIALIRVALERQIVPSSATGTASVDESNARQALERAIAHLPSPSALERICNLFGLSSFERDLLLLCAGMELESSFSNLCATAQGDPQRNYPTFSLSLSALPNPHWSALTPKAPLRRWQLIEVGPGRALTLSPLRIDERILHYLTGVQHLDERLFGMITPLLAAGEQVPSHQKLAEQIVAIWSANSPATYPPIIQLCGDDAAGKQAIASHACHSLGLSVYSLSSHTIPTNANDLYRFLRLWERESLLMVSALLLDCDDLETTDAAREGAIAQLTELINSPLIISTRDRRRSRQRPLITLDVYPPTSSEQRLLWHTHLAPAAIELNGQIDKLVSQFNLNAPVIQASCAEAIGRINRELQKDGRKSEETAVSSDFQALWDTCRVQARPRLDDLAQRIESGSAWNDLVLPDSQRQVLRDIAAHVRQRAKVYEQWGFAGKGGRGLGITALFAGASGTGKTMAADVLAQELQLDLYRIDLSSVVSKYIGETEKNLRRVFDAAEVGGVILLFDEADALFGKRSDVKDSHDRYANMEVSYLLQRMEAYRGLAILTTNLKDSLDQAFLRRLRFVVQFPFPSAEQRAEIWNRVFPGNTPTDGLDPRKLARLNVAGGNIRNIALNAAFLAADAEEPVMMKHVLSAARSEYAKLERPLTDSEVKGWI
ncbi:MAG TPA: AAA family ATPase [Crinalium sp.]|jgi:SpoVK/Ycf46/Vps4 family AAA+-type ATPase